MKKNELLSVIIPFYNAENSLRSMVESFAKEECPKLEIILVDDGSTDCSGKISDSIAARYNFVRSIHIKHSGVSKARNIGMKKSRGAWISFADADDFIYDDYFNVIFSVLDMINTDIVLFSYDELIGGKEYKQNHTNKTYNISSEKLKEMVLIDNRVKGYVWNKIFRKEAIEKNKIFFDEDIKCNEDLLFCYQFIECIDKGVFIDKAIYCYVKNGENSTTKAINEDHLSGLAVFDRIKYAINTNNQSLMLNIRKARLDMCVFLFKVAVRKGFYNNDVIIRIREEIISEQFKVVRYAGTQAIIVYSVCRCIPNFAFPLFINLVCESKILSN